MFTTAATTREQGDIGMAVAISEFAKLGYNISIPMTDNAPYDLIVDLEGALEKVQVKTTRHKVTSGSYEVQLKRVRPNRTENIIHKFDNEEADWLFVLVETGQCYMFPCRELTVKSALTLGVKYDKYKI